MYKRCASSMGGVGRDQGSRGAVELAEQKSWIHLYEDVIPAVFALYIGLEESARELTSFQLTLIPGLLQTADYRRAGIGRWNRKPATEVGAQCRYDHQATRTLHSDDFTFSALVCESALRYPIGGPAVMGRQLRHFNDVGQMPGVSIRVVPISRGMHVGLQVGSFSLRSSRSPDRLPVRTPVVYVDGYNRPLST